MIDGRLHAVPRVLNAGGVLQGARGGVDLPSADIDPAKSHLATHYATMEAANLWDRDTGWKRVP
ncbi:MAG: hypothetical protein H0U92_13035 [Actinobacteria bacterium]|nr:hypothetical protein [Actinomycetota bacterium]